MAKLSTPHHERHRSEHIGWLRASVLGANDGLISTSALLVGVASADATPQVILLTGVAALTAGALSMAAGEYVSVSAQADTERADRARESQELEASPESELRELTGIYAARGLTPDLARQVAEQLTARDALGAHLRDELGQVPSAEARPVQAAIASAAAFSVGGIVPLLVAWAASTEVTLAAVASTALAALAGLGVLAARAGGTPWQKPTARVVFWGALAMAVTSAVGAMFGAMG